MNSSSYYTFLLSLIPFKLIGNITQSIPMKNYYLVALRRKSVALWITLVCISNPQGLFAQEEAVEIGIYYSLDSKILGEERRIMVSHPPGYEASSLYPILYVLDGEWNFHLVSGMVNQLVASGKILPMLVVGIVNTQRNRDLTPEGPHDPLGRFGGAQAFLNFLTKELSPFVENQYGPTPYRILAGHSFGGLFSLYAMRAEPGFFDSIIALSPSLGRNDQQEVKAAAHFLKEKSHFPQSLYLAIGNEGGHTYYGTQAYKSLLEEMGNFFSWKFEHLPEENHVSITIQGFLEGIKFIFNGLHPEDAPGKLDELFLVEQHFGKLSKQYGFHIEVPETYYETFFREQLAQKEWDYAFFILDKYESVYPQSNRLLQSKGDIHLLMGEVEKAKTYYERLAEIDPSNEVAGAILENLKK